MSSTMNDTKQCVLCGEDCSQRLRVRDPKGRYYCQSCYDEARERRRTSARRAPEQIDMSLLDTELPGGPSAGDSTMMQAGVCPACAHVLSVAEVTCRHCGYDKRSGSCPEIETEASTPGWVLDADIKPVCKSTSVWPMITGVLSILLGFAGTAQHSVSFVNVARTFDAVRAAGTLETAVINLIVTAFLALLSFWLFWAGLGLVRRRPAAVASVKQWAMVNWALAILGMGGLLALSKLLGGPLVEAVEAVDVLPGAAGETPHVLSAWGGLFLWTIIWPTCLLIWLGRRNVRDEVRGWDPV